MLGFWGEGALFSLPLNFYDNYITLVRDYYRRPQNLHSPVLNYLFTRMNLSFRFESVRPATDIYFSSSSRMRLKKSGDLSTIH